MKSVLLILCVCVFAAISKTSAEEDAKFDKIIGKRNYQLHKRSGDQKPDNGCSHDYPIKDGLLCYPRCKAGYSNYGEGPVCWAKCPPATTNIGITCQKWTYGRGIGKTLRYCKSNMEKNGLLCYPKCENGYYGVGPVCWKSCASGYTDDGALCRIPLIVYGRDTSSCPWYNKCGLFGAICGKQCKHGYVNDGCTCRQPLYVYAKKTYGRGVGVPLSCGSDEEQSGALCYQPCRSGYTGVGPLCWAQCSGETMDTGVDCLKKSYGRGIGMLNGCIPLLPLIFKGIGLSSVTSFIKGGKDLNFTKATCRGLWAASKNAMNYLRSISKCSSSDNWNTMVVSFSRSWSVLFSVDSEIGIAFDFKKNKAVCYEQSCTGFNFDIRFNKIAVNYGWFRSLDDIPGKKRIVFTALDIPKTNIGVLFAGVLNSDAEYVGSLSTEGVAGERLNLTFDVGGASCNTPHDKIIAFTP